MGAGYAPGASPNHETYQVPPNTSSHPIHRDSLPGAGAGAPQSPLSLSRRHPGSQLCFLSNSLTPCSSLSCRPANTCSWMKLRPVRLAPFGLSEAVGTGNHFVPSRNTLPSGFPRDPSLFHLLSLRPPFLRQFLLLHVLDRDSVLHPLLFSPSLPLRSRPHPPPQAGSILGPDLCSKFQFCRSPTCCPHITPGSADPKPATQHLSLPSTQTAPPLQPAHPTEGHTSAEKPVHALSWSSPGRSPPRPPPMLLNSAHPAS